MLEMIHKKQKSFKIIRKSLEENENKELIHKQGCQHPYGILFLRLRDPKI